MIFSETRTILQALVYKTFVLYTTVYVLQPLRTFIKSGIPGTACPENYSIFAGFRDRL